MGCEPSLADLAAKVRIRRKAARPHHRPDQRHRIDLSSCQQRHLDESTLPAALIPSEPERTDVAYERSEIKRRVLEAISSLPPREQTVISLYYYKEATMKQIGTEIGVERVPRLAAACARHRPPADGLVGAGTGSRGAVDAPLGLSSSSTSGR
jgi:DNA-directed RNA polymerase specialized sigma subunit